MSQTAIARGCTGNYGHLSLPVVMLTTSNAPRDRDACARLGAAAYLVKPCDYDDFLILMRQAVALARPEDRTSA